MPRQIHLIKTRNIKKGLRQRTINREIKIGPVSLKVLTISALASLMLFYLAQSTQSATKSYEIQALQREKQEITEDVERLELEAVRLQSLRTITEAMGERIDKEFQAAGSVEAIQ